MNIGILIPIIAILAWPIVFAIRTWSVTRVRELEIRERIAMIEKGLTPPPERDPDRFDRMVSRFDHDFAPWRGPARHRRAGIVLIGVGLGLMFLLDNLVPVGRPPVGRGVGGFLMILGATFFAISLFEDSRRGRDDWRDQRPAPPPAPPSPQPPRQD